MLLEKYWQNTLWQKSVRGENAILIVLPIKNRDKVCDKAGNVTLHQNIIASYNMGLIDITVILLGHNY